MIPDATALSARFAADNQRKLPLSRSRKASRPETWCVSARCCPRLVNLLRGAGPVDVQYQGRGVSLLTIRPAPPSAAPCSIPTTIAKSWIFLRAQHHLPAACSSTSAADVRNLHHGCWRVTSAQAEKVIRDRAASHHPCAALRSTRAAFRLHARCPPGGPPPPAPSDGELMIETDGDNLGASHIVSGEPAGNAIRGCPRWRLQRNSRRCRRRTGSMR